MSAGRKSTCLAAAAIAAACACSHASGPAADQVKVEVASVGLDSETGGHYVLLADQSGGGTLPIVIGEPEARAIVLELHGLRAERPLTHDLMRSVIEQTGNHVDRVVIGDLRNETYYAIIYLDRGRYKVDSRPSDAIALALVANAPIYVASRLLDYRSEMPAAPGMPQMGRALGLTVQELTDQLAGALGEPAHSGVLVADVRADAARSGVQRGDIITAVSGTPVRTLKDFEHEAARLNGGNTVALALRREGTPQSVTLAVPTANEKNR